MFCMMVSFYENSSQEINPLHPASFQSIYRNLFLLLPFAIPPQMLHSGERSVLISYMVLWRSLFVKTGAFFVPANLRGAYRSVSLFAYFHILRRCPRQGALNL